MTARWCVAFIAAVLVEFGLVAFAAGVAEDRGREVVRLREHDRTIAARCRIFVDGSAICPPGVFDVPSTTTTSTTGEPK